MTFGNYRDSVPAKFEIQVNDKKLNRVESCKYLGIIFDYNLRWNEHIDYIYNKTKYLVFIFYKLSRVMNLDTLKLIYYAFSNSIITYGIIA